jgi:CBS domain containing-hemolysin-like protein
LLYPVIVIGDSVAKWTLGLFGVEMTGSWLETETDRVESRADLRHRLDSLLERGNLDAERREEIVNAFDVGDEPVRDVVTPRDEIVFLSTAVSVQENLDRIGSSPHTRFPLIGDGPEDFRGIVYVPAVVDRIDELRRGDVTFEDVAAGPMTLDAETPISEAVDRFQAEHQELALVRDGAEGAIVGLITATDAFEDVLGELEDPLDVELQDRSGPKSAPS